MVRFHSDSHSLQLVQPTTLPTDSNLGNYNKVYVQHQLSMAVSGHLRNWAGCYNSKHNLEALPKKETQDQITEKAG